MSRAHLDVRSRRGNVAMIVGGSMFALVLLAALAVDIGMARTQRGQLQTALDAAALAGASACNIDDDAVVDRAVELAGMNKVGTSMLAIDDGDVEIGDWDTVTNTLDTSCTACRHVQVTKSVTMTPAFALIASRNTITVSATAVAIGSPEPIECAIFGQGSFTVGGTGLVDSYDSTACGAASGCVYTDPPTLATHTAPRDNGDTCTNGQGEVFGSSSVCGDASSGMTYMTQADPADVCGSMASLAYDVVIPSPCVSSNQDAIAYPTLDIDNGTAATPSCTDTDADDWPDNFSNDGGPFNGAPGPSFPTPIDLKLTAKDSITIGPGVFQFGDISTAGGAEIKIVPPVELWATGTVDIGGHAVGTSASGVGDTTDPHDILVVAKGEMKLTGTGAAYGTYYSYGDFTAGGTSDYFGILVSHADFKVQGTPNIHLDESLPGIIEAEIIDGPPILVH